MGIWYELVNFTKRERLSFAHVGAAKAQEFAGNPAAAAITTWYLLWNPGDHICFVDDDYTGGIGRPAFAPLGAFPASPAEIREFPDRTDDVIRSLVAHGLLENAGFRYQDDDEPETVYILDLRPTWMQSDHRTVDAPRLPPTEFGVGERPT